MTDSVIELIQDGKDVTVTLTKPEKASLEACEEVIRKGLGTFLDVGRALAEIRDRRLYRETHKSFKKYCKDVWDLGKSTAHQKINCYQAVSLLGSKVSAMADTFSESDESKKATIVDKNVILPMNERQTRPLTKLKNPDDQVEAWRLVLVELNEGKKLTAALVNRAVKQVRGDVVKRKIKTIKKKVDSTQLVSNLFKRQYQVMVDVISEERNSGWKTTKQKEAVKWLKTLVKITESED